MVSLDPLYSRSLSVRKAKPGKIVGKGGNELVSGVMEEVLVGREDRVGFDFALSQQEETTHGGGGRQRPLDQDRYNSHFLSHSCCDCVLL
mmetsp:Transcript_21563/g.36742  ORF Transcript_21563/g.36742 Transcript_21563/m.36742 type:complete len:90 (+) Transcript_21563:60-329(+)